MNPKCIPTDDLGRVLVLPPDSPERRHLDECPRCRSLVLTYREFLEDHSAAEGADPREASRHLRAAFREAAEAHRAPPARRAPASAAPGFGPHLRDLYRRFGRSLVLVPAAAALLAIGLHVGWGWIRPGNGPDQLRGIESPGPAGLISLSLLEARTSETDRVEFSWRSVAGATAYEVVIMGEDLSDLARQRVPGDTTCVVRWLDLRPSPAPGAVLGWQVVGLRDATPLARSRIETLYAP